MYTKSCHVRARARRYVTQLRCCVYASFRALFSAGNTSISSASSSSRTTNVVLKSPEPPRGLATPDATSELADHIDNPDSPQLLVPAELQLMMRLVSQP